MKKQVVIIADSDPRKKVSGGVGIYSYYLSEYLVKKGTRVLFIGKKNDGPIINKLDKIKYVDANNKVGQSNYQFLIHLFRIANKVKIDDNAVIHAQRPDWLVPFSKRRNKKMVTLHGSHAKNVFLKKGWFIGRIYSFLEKKGLQTANTIICVSEVDKKCYSKKYPLISNKIKVIPVGVNSNFKPMEQKKLRKKYGFSVNDKIVLYVGRLEKEKQVDKIIQIFGKINAKLIVVGEGREESKLRDLVKQLNLKNITFIKGLEHNKIPEIMNCADALVLFSKHEGMPTVVLEALACGKPVVSSDVGDVNEVVINGKTGFIANKNNFSEYVKKVLQNPSKFKKNCVEIASNYSWDKIAKKTIKEIA